MGLVFLSSVSSADPKLRMAIIFPEDPSNTNGVGNVAKCMATAVVEDWKSKGSLVQDDYFNDKRDATEAGSVADAIVKGKYDVAIGTTLSSQALIVSKILDGSGIPFFAPLATHPGVVEGKKYSVRLQFSDRRQARKLAEFAVRKKPRRVLVVRNDSFP